MSEMTLSSLKERLGEIGARAAWAQWSALGAGTLHEGGSASAIIDPEALLLLSLHLIPEERRLRDLARWWAEVGSGLLSVQRTKTLAKDFPADVQERLHEFSRWATRAGDKRWKRYASEGTKNDSERDRKGPEDPQLRSPASLLLRLRAGFGVSAKADVLAFLLGIEGQTATTRKATEATGYSRATISGALEDLTRADFIEKSGGRPAEYRAPVRSWMALFHRSETAEQTRETGVPKWRYWAQLFAFLARARKWAHEAESLSKYMASTRARDLFEEFGGAFDANRIQVPSPPGHQGAEYLEGFQNAIKRIVQWVPTHL